MTNRISLAGFAALSISLLSLNPLFAEEPGHQKVSVSLKPAASLSPERSEMLINHLENIGVALAQDDPSSYVPAHEEKHIKPLEVTIEVKNKEEEQSLGEIAGELALIAGLYAVWCASTQDFVDSQSGWRKTYIGDIGKAVIGAVLLDRLKPVIVTAKKKFVNGAKKIYNAIPATKTIKQPSVKVVRTVPAA